MANEKQEGKGHWQSLSTANRSSPHHVPLARAAGCTPLCFTPWALGENKRHHYPCSRVVSEYPKLQPLGVAVVSVAS